MMAGNHFVRSFSAPCIDRERERESEQEVTILTALEQQHGTQPWARLGPGALVTRYPGGRKDKELYLSGWAVLVWYR